MKKDEKLEVYDTECFNLILEVKEHSISTTELIKYLAETSELFKALNHSLNRYYSCGYDQILIDVEALDGKGLSRVDFFVDEKKDRVCINEINTLPGFTSISMYPKLFMASGLTYTELLNEIINIALED